MVEQQAQGSAPWVDSTWGRIVLGAVGLLIFASIWFVVGYIRAEPWPPAPPPAAKPAPRSDYQICIDRLGGSPSPARIKAYCGVPGAGGTR